VAEGLSTAFMVLDQADIATLCDRAPGVEAWLFAEAPAGGRPALVRLGAPASTGEDASGGPPGADRP
jgi:hypothetical protein